MAKTRQSAIKNLQLKIKDYEARIERLKLTHPGSVDIHVMRGAIEGYEVSIKQIEKIRRFFA